MQRLSAVYNKEGGDIVNFMVPNVLWNSASLSRLKNFGDSYQILISVQPFYKQF